jgi:hypothetical protein
MGNEVDFVKLRGNVVEIIHNPSSREFHRRIRNAERNGLRFAYKGIATFPSSDHDLSQKERLRQTESHSTGDYWFADAGVTLHREICHEIPGSLGLKDWTDQPLETIHENGEARFLGAGVVDYIQSEECYAVYAVQAFGSYDAPRDHRPNDMLKEDDKFESILRHRPIIYEATEEWDEFFRKTDVSRSLHDLDRQY